MSKFRPIAMYLPQYHPIPENDLWWGKGFTEWTNVVKAKPLLKNHYQPHLPADLGFYDLRVPEIREAQAQMAMAYGISGFCYYHYWFNGKQLLNRPVDEILTSSKPDFPFCLCWANENWTRTWNGSNTDILIKQNYNFEDDRNHINFLLPYFKDPRYIKIDGKPLFIIYKPELFPDIKTSTRIWREEARKAGAGELYLCYFENRIIDNDPGSSGFDASVEFQPSWEKLPQINMTLLQRILQKSGIKKYVKNLDYKFVAETIMQNSLKVKYKRYPCVMPMWDNTARKEYDGIVFHNSTPELYGNWLKKTIQEFKPYSKEENFIFINAWNEWAEGNHLEPCQKWGRKYLEETKQILEEFINE